MRPADALKAKMEEFGFTANYEFCAACRHPKTFNRCRAHHVVYRQHLPVEHEWRTENVMPVCDPCHEKHHNASKRISVDAVTDVHREFAKEVLGDAAEYYWTRYYGPSSTTDA